EQPGSRCDCDAPSGASRTTHASNRVTPTPFTRCGALCNSPPYGPILPRNSHAAPRPGRNIVKRAARFLFATLWVLAVSVHAQPPAPKTSADPAWPRTAVADPTRLGFTKTGLDALDARLKQAVADGDTAGMTYMLIRHGQVADFKSIGQQTPDKPMAPDSL